MISNGRSFITGIKGTKLNKKEVKFFKKNISLGVLYYSLETLRLFLRQKS
jgi:hypothetical protein